MGLVFNPFKASSTLLDKQKKRDEAENAVSNYGDFTASDYLNQAEQNKIHSENAVKNYGDFNYKNQDALNKAMDDYLNRKNFSFDLNADALYQQYKDNYMSQGKLAMMDTMGQAAAMTGGYGNSYAATVGNQAFQGHLTKLNEIAPQLYQMALDKYNQEGQDILQRYSLLTDDRANEYGMWNDVYNKLLTERDYAGNNYNNTYAKEYAEWNDAYNKLKDNYTMLDNAAKDLYTMEYGAYSDDIANQKWNADYNLSARQIALSEAAASQPTYAINTMEEVSDDITNKLNSFVTNVSFGTSERSKSFKEKYARDISEYISDLVNTGRVSPGVGDELMSRYMSRLNKL